MNCESVSKNLGLFLYGELSLEEEQALQDHVESCARCRQAFETEKRVHAALDARETDPPPELLVRCRRDLSTRLDTLAPHRTGALAAIRTFFGTGFSWAAAMRPAGAVALIALGFFGARWTARPPATVASTPDQPGIMRVRYLQPESSGQVRLVVEETRQKYVTGNPQDEAIQRLLLAAARESADPGVRADSVEILKHRAASNEIRDALVQALQTDTNPGIRLRALDGLKSYAADPEVQRALAQALLSDDNPGVRTQAIDLLVQNRRDEALVGVLQELLQKESNSYVRLRSERALKDMNASVGTF